MSHMLFPCLSVPTTGTGARYCNSRAGKCSVVLDQNITRSCVSPAVGSSGCGQAGDNLGRLTGDRCHVTRQNAGDDLSDLQGREVLWGEA
jgi:hypothetical protein